MLSLRFTGRKKNHRVTQQREPIKRDKGRLLRGLVLRNISASNGRQTKRSHPSVVLGGSMGKNHPLSRPSIVAISARGKEEEY